MDKKFLYKKAYPIGVLDDGEDDDLEQWFLDDSRDVFEKRIRECDFEDLIMELIDILRSGQPNYIQLAILFGFENVEETKIDNMSKVSFYEIQRRDIIKIEMDIEELASNKTLILRNLYLYVYNKYININVVNKISKKCDNIWFDENDEMIIHERECNIIII